MMYYGAATGENGVGVGEIVCGDTFTKTNDGYTIKDIEVFTPFMMQGQTVVYVDSIKPKVMFLSESARSDLIDYVANEMVDNMFGDGFEKEYVIDGASFPGINELDDEELIQEMENFGFNEQDKYTGEYRGEVVYIEAKAQQAIYNELKE